jgi:hypothetical protein
MGKITPLVQASDFPGDVEGNPMNRNTFKLLAVTVLVLALSLWLSASVVLAGMGWSG